MKTAHSLKNPIANPPLKMGDIVLVECDLKNKLLWKLERIQRVIPGRDGNILSYEVHTMNGILKKISIQHLCPFERWTDELMQTFIIIIVFFFRTRKKISLFPYFLIVLFLQIQYPFVLQYKWVYYMFEKRNVIYCIYFIFITFALFSYTVWI